MSPFRGIYTILIDGAARGEDTGAAAGCPCERAPGRIEPHVTMC
jgi:hypothetical protein